MKIFERISSLLLSALWKIRKRRQKPSLSPQEVAKRLSPDVQALVQKEADFLLGQHNVQVRALADGESPSIPRQAQP